MVDKSYFFFGAGDEARTRYLHLGKVALYRMSYTRGTKMIITDFKKMSIGFLLFLQNIFAVKPGCIFTSWLFVYFIRSPTPFMIYLGR